MDAGDDVSSYHHCFILSPLVLRLYGALHFLVVLDPLILPPASLSSANDDNARSSSNLHNPPSPNNMIQNKDGTTNKSAANNTPKQQQSSTSSKANTNKPPSTKQLLLSRNPKVEITSSARGNLGPPSVLNQDPPGKDWIKDRWQAASDMGGTAIPGSHWIILDFSNVLLPLSSNKSDTASVEGVVHVTKIILDWETAFARNYRIEGRLTPPPPPISTNKHHEQENNDDEWCVLYDGALDSDNDQNKKTHTNNNSQQQQKQQQPHRSVEESGQSPGVKQKLPLHIIHTIDWTNNNDGTTGNSKSISDSSHCHRLKYLRIFIRKHARGWAP